MIPATDPTLTIAPFASRNAGTAARLRYQGPIRFTPRIRCHSSSSTPSRSANGTRLVVPALLTTISSASEPLQRGRDQPSRVLLAGDVALHVHGLRKRAGERLALLDRARRVDDHPGAVGGEPLRDRPADAAGRPRDDDDLAHRPILLPSVEPTRVDRQHADLPSSDPTETEERMRRLNFLADEPWDEVETTTSASGGSGTRSGPTTSERR